jgi:periplasmic protein TonB
MSPQYMQDDRSRIASFALVASAHVLGAYLLLLHAPTREAVKQATVFMVTLIREQPKAESKPTELPKPLPVKPTVTRPEPVPIPLVATTTAPADITAPPPAPQPPAQPIRPAQTGPAQVAAISPPKFDADYLDNPPPVYPRLSKRLGEVGNVMLMVFVDAEGRPGQIDIQTSSRFERLDQAAIEAVRRWKFVAAKQGEKAVAAWVLVPIYFSLKS